MGMMAKESDAQLDVLVEEVTESMLLSHFIAPTVLITLLVFLLMRWPIYVGRHHTALYGTKRCCQVSVTHPRILAAFWSSRVSDRKDHGAIAVQYSSCHAYLSRDRAQSRSQAMGH